MTGMRRFPPFFKGPSGFSVVYPVVMPINTLTRLFRLNWEYVVITTMQTQRALNTVPCVWRATTSQFHEINVLRDCFVASPRNDTHWAVIASEAWRSQLKSKIVAADLVYTH